MTIVTQMVDIFYSPWGLPVFLSAYILSFLDWTIFFFSIFQVTDLLFSPLHLMLSLFTEVFFPTVFFSFKISIGFFIIISFISLLRLNFFAKILKCISFMLVIAHESIFMVADLQSLSDNSNLFHLSVCIYWFSFFFHSLWGLPDCCYNNWLKTETWALWVSF